MTGSAGNRGGASGHPGGRHPVLVPEDWDQHLDAAEWSLGEDGLPFRTAARVLAVTDDGEVLLLVGHDAADPAHSWVFTPGGGLRSGEDPRSGAVRELVEESGIEVAPADLEGPIAHREAIFRFASVTCRQDEIFFLLHLPTRCPIRKDGWTCLERDVVVPRATQLLHVLGLWEAGTTLVADYSAGMRKKVHLACALVHSPSVLVLDEPFEAVDPISARTIRSILADFAAAGGTVIISSHVMATVQRLCDHVAIINAGRVVAAGTTEQVAAGADLEQRFTELVGAQVRTEGLSWLRPSSS